MTKSRNGSGWKVEIVPRAEKELRKLGTEDQRRVRRFLRDSLEGTANPRAFGKPLQGPQAGYWRYRVGDLRILCRLEDARVVIVVVEVGHRREIYR